LYGFVKMDQDRFNIKNDEQMVLDLLEQEKILVVHGRAFNWPEPDHFRIVFLPRADDLTVAIGKMARFFEKYKQ
jgi:alanine-synthesizing transaminase